MAARQLPLTHTHPTGYRRLTRWLWSGGATDLVVLGWAAVALARVVGRDALEPLVVLDAPTGSGQTVSNRCTGICN